MLTFLLLAQAATIPVPAAPCTLDAALPPALAFWTQPAAGPELTLFRPVVLATTEPTTANPAHPGKVAATTFTIAEAGTYSVALGGRGWIDVLPATGGTPLTSVAHGHGPACTTVGKLVAYRLAPGTYRLRLSELPAATAKVALVPGSPAAETAK